MADSADVLYKDYFEGYINEFCRVCNGETTIVELTPLIELLKTSSILKYIMTDPTNDAPKACVREYLFTHRNVNQDFLSKFLSVVSIKINIAPVTVGFINQSFNAKIIYNNIRPASKLTNLTVQTKHDELRDDAKRAVVYEKARRPPAQTIKLKLDSDTLTWCVNAIYALNTTIVEGNRANGRETNDFVTSNMK